MQMSAKLRDWAVFAALGLTWGSSFMWIKIAVAETAPITVVGLRLMFGWLGMLGIVGWKKTRLPRDRATWLKLLFLGFLNTALPFSLITWGETRIDSGLASILNGTVPLFTIVIAHLFLHDEKITLPRIGGLIAGFLGVAVLFSRDLNLQGALASNLLGQLAVLVASLCYGTAIVFSRRQLRNVNPIVQSLGVLVIADTLVWVAALGLESPVTLPVLPITWLAIGWLGLLGSCLAYLMFYHLINVWGSTRTSLVTYIMPVVGLVLGIVFLDEVLDWRLLVGSALIMSGIVLANRIPRPVRATADMHAGQIVPENRI